MTVSTHVLDTSLGRPAAGVAVALQRQHGSSWMDLLRGVTTADGRVAALVPAGTEAPAGAYRLTFDVGAYFSSRGVESFYNIAVTPGVTSRQTYKRSRRCWSEPQQAMSPCAIRQHK